MVVVEHAKSDYLNSKFSKQSVLDTVSVYNSLSVRMSISTLSFQASILYLVNYVKKIFVLMYSVATNITLNIIIFLRNEARD